MAPEIEYKKEFGRIVKSENDNTKMVFSDIIGEKELFILNIMFSELTKEKSGSYKGISLKDPETYTRDILNSECALCEGLIDSKKVEDETKKYFDKFELLMLALQRLNSTSLEELENKINEIHEEFRGERVYMEGRRQLVCDISTQISGLLSRKYSMTNKEVGERLGKSSEQVRKYLVRLKENPYYVYSDIFEEISEIMDKQHKELLEKQDNKLFVRHGRKSKKYTMIDLNKKEGEKGRTKIITEEEVKKILEDIKSNKNTTKSE